VQLPLLSEPLRARATVRYQDKLRCGLEFAGLSAEQRAAIRDWVKEAKAEPELSAAPPERIDEFERAREEKNSYGEGQDGRRGQRSTGHRRRWRRMVFFLILLLLAAGAALFWWKWNRGWEEIESGVKNEETATEKPQAQVPAEVMEKLLIHRVEPVYPAGASQQGIIALDVVVGRDGSVVSMRPLNGPDVLARAAMDALRWWKFEPYRINGEPSVVETRVAVEFKR
jgi:hypothetical protein